MYLFCLRVDLALEQTAGLIGRERPKVRIYPQQHSADGRSVRAPSFATPAMPPEPSRGAEGTRVSLSPQKVVISQHEYPSLGPGFFIWLCNLRNDRTRSPPTVYPLPTSLLWCGF